MHYSLLSFNYKPCLKVNVHRGTKHDKEEKDLMSYCSLLQLTVTHSQISYLLILAFVLGVFK